MSPLEVDVCIVGYGPVGQTMAALLGRRGWRVAVFERWEEPYPLPRAGHIDDELMRVLQQLGIAEEFEVLSVPAASYDWIDANHDLLFQIDWNRPTTSTWKSDYIFYQPDVERLLSRAAEQNPTVSIHRGWEARGLEADADGVTVEFVGGTQVGSRWEEHGGQRTVRARYVIGADGANSFVRTASNLEWEDLGYSQTMSVVDVAFDELDTVIDMPSSGQLCDPARPITLFRWLARAHARWEFLLLPGEDPDDLVSESTSWRLLEKWGVTPANARLVRRTLYTFRSLVAREFRRGRVLVVGDAAHLMPPFLGQGMCSGMRDAANLAWKLDDVLAGRSAESLLDTVTTERRDHVRTLTHSAVALAGVLCETDPERARIRDEAIRRDGVPVPPGMPGLTSGIIARRGNAVAGSFSVQGHVVADGRIRRFEDLVPAGWTLMCADRATAHAARAVVESNPRLGDVRVVSFSKATLTSPGSYVDFDGTYERWFRASGSVANLVRPDFYCFGGASRADEVGALLEDAFLRAPGDPTLAATPAAS
jgi:2-polyprenyl-6-methoxyphenol hydroxylase-like FAD-dependent oxidoreductase